MNVSDINDIDVQVLLPLRLGDVVVLRPKRSVTTEQAENLLQRWEDRFPYIPAMVASRSGPWWRRGLWPSDDIEVDVWTLPSDHDDVMDAAVTALLAGTMNWPEAVVVIASLAALVLITWATVRS